MTFPAFADDSLTRKIHLKKPLPIQESGFSDNTERLKDREASACQGKKIQSATD